MKLNSSQLEAFFALTKLLNFTRAAESIHVTQSALSQRIAKLEETLETTLFIRDRTFVRLTESGEQVLRFCQLNENAESDLLLKLKDSAHDFAGVVRIGGFSSVNRALLIPALKNLMHKNSRLSLHISTKEIFELDSLLKRCEVDYVLTTKKSNFPEVQSILLGHEEYVLVKSKKYPEIKILLDHDENDTTSKDYFHTFKVNYKPIQIRYLDDIYGLIDGVKYGYGMAILPIHLIMAENELKIVEPKKILRVPVYLQFYTQPYYKGIHSALISDIRSYFLKNLS